MGGMNAGSYRKRIFMMGAVILAAVVFFGFTTGSKHTDRIQKVICLGDSITYGTGVKESRDYDAYPVLLESMLGEAYEVYNYGASGRTLLSSGDKPYSATGYIEEAVKEQPNIILIMLGTNDSKHKNWDAKKYQTEYRELLQNLKAQIKGAEIYIMIPPIAFTDGEKQEYNGMIDNEVIRTELHKIIRDIAEQEDVELISLYAVTEGHPEYYSDAVHPNRKGNEIMARAIYEAIK